MRRARLPALIGLPLLATLLAAQAPAPAPAPQAKKPATAAKPSSKPAAAPKPLAPKALAPNKLTTKKSAAKKPEPKKYDFADYFRIWGVSGDTTRAEIVARFGEPQRVGDSSRKPFYYFNDTLTFFFGSDDTVNTMIVGNSFAAIPPKTIPPEVIDKAFIGRTRDDVLKNFGPANIVSSDNYKYFPKAGVYKIEFQCYDIERYVCKQMLVQF
ncbi:MAG TPA: hypothetical protein VFA57_06815 [Pseudolabrys sp.]|nr:hypothetical protein [Pseudolabrys sp.]